MKQDGNDELIMLNHANITCLCIAVYKTTSGTAQGEPLIDVHYGALSWLEPLQLADNKQ
jgi:hypothetical protein